MDARFPISDALKVAQQLQSELAIFCERIVIAGSIRRQKPTVSDIELLFVPKLAPAKIKLFDEGDMAAQTDIVITHWLNEQVLRKRPSEAGRFAWGPKNKLAIHMASGIPVDLFSTTLDNWWNALVLRTGSKETCLRLTTGAIGLGKSWAISGPGVVSNGVVTPAHSEEEVFELCGVPYLPPEKR